MIRDHSGDVNLWFTQYADVIHSQLILAAKWHIANTQHFNSYFPGKASAVAEPTVLNIHWLLYWASSQGQAQTLHIPSEKITHRYGGFPIDNVRNTNLLTYLLKSSHQVLSPSI